MPLNWRAELTPLEASQIAAADEAKSTWERLNAARAGIVNRAIQRAKYRNRPGTAPSGGDA